MATVVARARATTVAVGKVVVGKVGWMATAAARLADETEVGVHLVGLAAAPKVATVATVAAARARAATAAEARVRAAEARVGAASCQPHPPGRCRKACVKTPRSP